MKDIKGKKDKRLKRRRQEDEIEKEERVEQKNRDMNDRHKRITEGERGYRNKALEQKRAKVKSEQEEGGGKTVGEGEGRKETKQEGRKGE